MYICVNDLSYVIVLLESGVSIDRADLDGCSGLHFFFIFLFARQSPPPPSYLSLSSQSIFLFFSSFHVLCTGTHEVFRSSFPRTTFTREAVAQDFVGASAEDASALSRVCVSLFLMGTVALYSVCSTGLR